MVTEYSINQIMDNEKGWLFYDSAYMCWKEIYRYISGSSVLDIGCAGGITMGLIKLFNPHLNVVGFEGSDDGKAIWQSRGLEVHNGDIYELPFNNNAFDTVYTSHVLEHCEFPDTIINETIRVAAKRIIHIVPDGDVESKNFGTPHLRTYNRKTFEELFAARKDLRQIHYAPILDAHMNSLIGVYELES